MSYCFNLERSKSQAFHNDKSKQKCEDSSMTRVVDNRLMFATQKKMKDVINNEINTENVNVCQMQRYFFNAGEQPLGALINMIRGAVDESFERILSNAEKNYGPSVYLGGGSKCLSTIQTGDKLVFIAHGNGTYIYTWLGQKDGKEFAQILIDQGLDSDSCKYVSIELLSCNNGGVFAQTLAYELLNTHNIFCSILGSLNPISIDLTGTPKYYTQNHMEEIKELDAAISIASKEGSYDIFIHKTIPIPKILKEHIFKNSYSKMELDNIRAQAFADPKNFTTTAPNEVVNDLIFF